MANIPPIDKFKFFANMALPLVYDETLSYYETLNKVVYKLNEIINLANTQSQAIEDFETQITEFVTTWENNLKQELEEWKTDTEEDIDGWLNNALDSITAWEEQFENEYTTLKTEVEQIAEDADAAKTAAKNSATAAAESATAAEESAATFSTDTTLTIAGKAADAKVTGDRISAIENNSAITKSIFSDSFIIINGKYTYRTGEYTEASIWCCTKYFVPKDITIITNNGYKMKPAAYDIYTGEYIGEWNSDGFYKIFHDEYITMFDYFTFKKKYPNYEFKINFTYDRTTEITPDVVIENSIFYNTNNEYSSFNNSEIHKTIQFNDGNVHDLAYSNFSMICNKNFIYYNYPGDLTRTLAIKITNDVKYLYPSTNIRDELSGLQLIPNKHYILKAQLLNGESDESIGNPVYIGVYKVGEILTIGETTYSNGVFERKFIAPEEEINFAILLTSGNYYKNCLIYVTLYEDGELNENIDNYYIDEMNDTISKIRTNTTEPSIVFPIVTDIHRYTEQVQTFNKMINNITALKNNIKCNFIACTGDTIEGDKQKSVSKEQAYDCIRSFKNINEPFVYAQGNHDNNPYISSSSLKFSMEEIFSMFFSTTLTDNYNFSENGTDFYIDFESLNTRLIVMNSCNVKISPNYGYGHSTAAWLTNALNTNKDVIILTHVSPIKEHVWNNVGHNQIDTVNAINNFISNGGNVVLITGHSHIDAEFVNPYIEITNGCQRFQMVNTSDAGYQLMSGQIDGLKVPNRTEGTYTEDLWTIAIFKPNSKEIDMIRFGAGNDRYIHYKAITPTTLTSKLTNVTWSSSDNTIATVSDGTITGVSNGSCAIIAKDNEDNIEVWKVNVTI